MKAEHLEACGVRISDGLSAGFSIKLVFRCNAVNNQFKGWFTLITSSSKLLLQCHLVEWMVQCHGFTKVGFLAWRWRDLLTESESRTWEFTSNSPHFNQKLPEYPRVIQGKVQLCMCEKNFLRWGRRGHSGWIKQTLYIWKFRIL